MDEIRNSLWQRPGRWRQTIFFGLSDAPRDQRPAPLACRLALHAWNTETIAPGAIVETCCACGTERVLCQEESDRSRMHRPEHTLESDAWPTAGVI